MKIIMDHNQGFKWYHKDYIWAKGYLFDSKQNLYEKENILNYFSDVSCFAEFRTKLNAANGSFAVIIQCNGKTFAAVDRLRSIPLFYSIAASETIISDNAYKIKDNISSCTLDEVKVQEFKLTAYTVGDSTLIKEIKQVIAGQCICFEEDSLAKEFYYRHIHTNFMTQNSKEEIYEQLDDVSNKIFKRLIHSVNNRQIVVPLSGGYDSRYIVAMLKKLNYENVLCFTYGRKDSFEVETSQRVATQLGYKWHFVEYTSDKWDIFLSKEHEKYVSYASNLSSLPHVQDFLAVLELREKNLIESNAVIVPGYCGDLLGGSYLVNERDMENISLTNLVTYIYEKHFNLTLEKNLFNNIILSNIRNNIFQEKIIDREDFISLNEEFFTLHKVAKFVVNAVRAYEYFGYEWRMPLWDNVLMDFWYRVPSKYRQDSCLYNGYLLETIFKDLNIDFKKEPSLAVKYPVRLKIKKTLDKLLPQKLVTTIRNLYMFNFHKKEIDFNDFSSLANKLMLDIKVKSDIETNNINYVYALWYLNKKKY